MSRSCWLLLVAAGACSYGGRIEDPVDVAPWRPARHAEIAAPRETGRASTPPEEEKAYPIDLATVLRLAGSDSIEIKLARAKAKEAVHAASEEIARLLPALRPRLAFQRIDGQVQDTGGSFLDVRKQSAFAGGSLEVVIQPGEAIYRSLAARKREKAAVETMHVTTHRTLLAAAQRYFALVASRARISIAEDAVKAAKELLGVEQSRAETGAGLPAAVSRAKARVAETEGQVESARADAAMESSRLAEILALEHGLLLAPKATDAAAPIELVDARKPLAELLQLATQRRPELKMAAAELEASSAMRAKTGIGWVFPELRLGAGYGEFGRNLGHLDHQESYWAALQWRLDFGMLSRHKAAKERERQAELVLEGQRNSVAASVAMARRRILATRSRIAAARTEVEAATETLRLVKTRETEGDTILLVVLDAQSTLSRARTALVVAVAEHNAAQYALLRAVGGPPE